MPLNVNQLQLSRTLTRQGSGFESARGRSDGRKEAVASSVPFSVPFRTCHLLRCKLFYFRAHADSIPSVPVRRLTRQTSPQSQSAFDVSSTNLQVLSGLT